MAEKELLEKMNHHLRNLQFELNRLEEIIDELRAEDYRRWKEENGKKS